MFKRLWGIPVCPYDGFMWFDIESYWDDRPKSILVLGTDSWASNSYVVYYEHLMSNGYKMKHHEYRHHIQRKKEFAILRQRSNHIIIDNMRYVVRGEPARDMSYRSLFAFINQLHVSYNLKLDKVVRTYGY